MANMNPYTAARINQRFMKDILSQAGKIKEQEFQTGIQTGEMRKEYGRDIRDKITKISEAIRKAESKRYKPKWYQKLIPLAMSLVATPVAAGVTSGLFAAESTGQAAKVQEANLTNLQRQIRKHALEGDWANTFLGEKAADFKAGRLEQASNLDSLIAQAKKASSFGNILTSGLKAGVMEYGTQMMAGGDEVGSGAGTKSAGGHGIIDDRFLSKEAKQKLAKEGADKKLQDLLNAGTISLAQAGSKWQQLMKEQLKNLKGYNLKQLLLRGDTSLKDMFAQFLGEDVDDEGQAKAQMALLFQAIANLEKG